MALGMLDVFGLVLKVCAFAWILVAQGSAVPPIGDGTLGQVPNASVPIGISPTPGPQPNGTVVQPPQVMPPPESAPGPQTMKGLPPPIWPAPSTSPPSPFVPPPEHNIGSIPPEKPPHNLPYTVEAPAPVMLPSNGSPPIGQIHPAVPESVPPKPPASSAPVAASPPPVTTAAPPTGMHASPPPSRPVLPVEPPSLPPDFLTHPALPGNQHEPPSSPPAQSPPQVLAPPPSISKNAAAPPFAAPPKRTVNYYKPVSHIPAKAPTASKPMGHPNSAPPLQLFPKSGPVVHPPTKHHHTKMYPAPASHASPPISGYFPSAPPNASSFPPSNNHYSSVSPSVSPSQAAKIPLASPKLSPLGISPRSPRTRQPPPLQALSPRTRQPPPLQALPPPPPNTDCTSLTCQEPLAYGPPESPCACVLPIQVGLQLTVSLYTFFPLVSELAAEIATGVLIKQSQVRIMGANAAEGDPDRTIAHIDLLPLGRKFEDAKAFETFQRFWNKQVTIKPSFFGNYDVLYVQYPGLPPSPPLPPSTIGIINKPYPGRDNNTRSMQPLGVDISGEQHKHRPSGSMLAAIIISCFVGLILLCAILWVLIFRHQHCFFWSDPTPPNTIRSHAKSSGIPVSMVGSGPSSPTVSLGSNIAACTGSARTFSLSDIERASDFFNEMRIIGEGGFGRVYSGVLEDGTKVAIKILKRSDQQGDREFLAEVEMLSRLHHRNLVKLIGICIEGRTRCLVYELITNGSVESHLHGIDKERSPLNWTARLKIALGAARALAYLHEDSCPRVIHRDFKASNILLEDDFTPKVSDFGLARSALDEESRHISTRVMGTFGYLAPEYAMTGHLLVKSDVYSYGVVLLELLTGRKPVDMSQPPGQENLVSWARPLLTNREGLESIVDPSLGFSFPSDSIAKVAAIASMCVQPEVSHRPFMGEVIQALQLVCNECGDETQDVQSRGSSHDDFSMILGGRDSDSAQSGRLVEALLTPSSINGYNYELDVESDISLSELLSSAANAGATAVQGSESPSFRRYCSSSGPIRTSSKTKQIWKTTVRQLSTMRGSVSEHRVLRRLWPGSH